MTIVVLDGFTLNPGDLSWDPLLQLGSCTIHDRTSQAELLRRSTGAEILLTNKTLLDARTIMTLPALRYIGVLATGYNVVAVEAAARRGVVVSNVPAYGTKSVAQMVFAHLLHLTQHVELHAASVRAGDWAQSVDFCYWKAPLVELDGMTMGIVGYGRIGRETASIARGFGMRILVHDPSTATADGVDLVSLDRLFRESDVVSLHCPLTPATTRMVDAERLAMMKPTALLLNTSRGPLIDEHALADALTAGRLGGAALDVLSIEPPPADHPLLRAPRCVITPHIAWATRAARERLLGIAVENLRAFLDGRPRNVVTPVP
jgi:glycerate dehydrogenase